MSCTAHVGPNLTEALTLVMHQSCFEITPRAPEQVGRPHHQHGIARNNAQVERPQEGSGGEQVHQHAHHDGGNAKAQSGQAQRQAERPKPQPAQHL